MINTSIKHNRARESPTHPTAEFRQMLEQVNLAGRSPLPGPDGVIHDATLFDDLFVPDDGLEEVARWLPDMEKEWLDEMQAFLDHSLEERSLAFRRFILGDADLGIYVDEVTDSLILAKLWRDTVSAALRYQETRSWQIQMNYLVDVTERIVLAMGKARKFESAAQREHVAFKLANLPESTIYEVDEDAVLSVRPGGLLEALVGKDLARIRRCKKCERIFWAKRWDSKCCSPECNNAYNALQSINRRKTDQDYSWKQEIKHRANMRANEEFKLLNFTDADIDAYRKRYRKYPHRIIYDYILKTCLQSDRLTPEKVSIQKVTDHLQQFKTKRNAH